MLITDVVEAGSIWRTVVDWAKTRHENSVTDFLQEAGSSQEQGRPFKQPQQNGPTPLKGSPFRKQTTGATVGPVSQALVGNDWVATDKSRSRVILTDRLLLNYFFPQDKQTYILMSLNLRPDRSLRDLPVQFQLFGRETWCPKCLSAGENLCCVSRKPGQKRRPV